MGTLIYRVDSADGVSNARVAAIEDAHGYLFNEASWDRERGNTEVTVLVSGEITETTNGTDQTNYNAKGVRLFLDITAESATLDVKVQGKDPVSSKYYDIPDAVFSIKSTTGTDDLLVYPGVAETAYRSVSDVIPRTWRLVYTVGGGDPTSVTFSVGASYVV